MIDLKLTVVHADGVPYNVAPTAATLIEAEDHFGSTLAELFSPAKMSLKGLAFLAWEQSRADGIAVKPFDVWRKQLVSVDMEVDDDPLDEMP